MGAFGMVQLTTTYFILEVLCTILSSLSRELLERISEVARQNGIDVTWYRHEGYPVALLRFQADQQRPTLQFKAVKFEPGCISIHGQANEEKAEALPAPIQLAFQGD